MGVSSLIQGVVDRLLPTPLSDGNISNARMSKYGELITRNNANAVQATSVDGSYIVATNPTPGTAIAMTTSITAFAETAGAVGVMFLLRNTLTSSETAKRIIMDYLKMRIVQVPTSATSWEYAVTLDDNPARYTSGGGVIVPTNPNGAVSTGSIATLYFGALTTGVPTNRRLVGRGTLRGIIPTTFDVMSIIFGSSPTMQGLHTSGSGKYFDVTAPVIISPGQNMAITMWGAANAAAPSFEFEAGWIER